MPRISFEPLFGSYIAVFILFVSIAVLFLLVKPEGERLTKNVKIYLYLLRFTVIFILFFAAIRPVLIYTSSQRLSATLNILIDQSESMTRPVGNDGRSRYQLVRDTLTENQDILKSMQQEMSIQCFAFDSALKPLELHSGKVEGLSDKPIGTETAIGKSLEQVRQLSAGKRVLGTILFSDGTQRCLPANNVLPSDAAVRFHDNGIPLYTVPIPFGQTTIEENPDVAVVSMQANEHIFVKNELQVSGSVSVNGFLHQDIPVQLYFEDSAGIMQLVQEKPIRASANGQVMPYQFAFSPQQTGYFKYTVSIPPQQGELVEANNSQSGFVRVMDGGLNVLFLQGELHNEQGHLRNSLQSSSDINVDYRSLQVGVFTGGNSQLPIQKRLAAQTAARESLVEKELAAGKYNVYILDSIDAAAFKAEELKILAQRVSEGGSGLIMLGGYYSFGAGGYSGTPLANVSPVVFSATDRQQPDAPRRTDIHWTDPLSMLPKDLDGGRYHYVMRLVPNPQPNLEKWKSFPPLDGANRFDKMKPGATVLAEGQNGEVLLVSHIFGLGRVLAFAGDTTYRWRLAGHGDEHRRFWRQIILWLAKMDDVMEGDCWIELENSRLSAGESVKFKVFLRTPDGLEVRNFNVKTTVIKPDGKEESVQCVDENGIPTGSFHLTELAGDYKILVETLGNADKPHTATARFIVSAENRELVHPIPDFLLMERIAAATEGQCIPPEQFSSLLKELNEKSEQLLEYRETKKTLYDIWAVLLLFAVFMTCEWFLRKKYGLA